VTETPRILVTGAGGFIGRQTLHPLLAQGYEVHGVGRGAAHATTAGYTHHQADLTDPSAVAALLRAIAPQTLLHLAWDVTPGAFWQARTNLDWVAASLTLYRGFVANGGRRAVFAGSCAEYEWSRPYLDEVATPLLPATLYGTAKNALHEILGKVAALDGVSLAWARLFMLYGPYECEARLVASVALALLRGEPAFCGDGTAWRDFMHVTDVGRALALIAAREITGPINVASGECTRIADVIGIIAELTGRGDLVRLGARQAPTPEPVLLQAATARLTGLGFQPRFTLRDGLADTIAWWRGQSPRL
jgi:nucleoside-diphosphate-sugar epimerase